jgi:hypothetical protein
MIKCNCSVKSHQNSQLIPGLVQEWGLIDSNLQAFKQKLIDHENASLVQQEMHQEDKRLIVSNDLQGNSQVMAPSQKHKEIIASKRPSVKADEMMVVTWVASHNLMSHSMGVWDLASLYEMAKKFPAGIGRPLQCDHEWYEMSTVKGFIFDSRLLRSNQAPDTVIEGEPEFVEINQEIVASEGYYSLELDTAIPVNSEFGMAVASGLIGDCSTGGLRENVFYCPICSKSQGRMVDFFKDADICPHIPPLPMMSWFYDFNDPEIQKILAPYYIRGGFKVAIELSAVVKGDLPGAEIMYPLLSN